MTSFLWKQSTWMELKNMINEFGQNFTDLVCALQESVKSADFQLTSGILEYNCPQTVYHLT